MLPSALVPPRGAVGGPILERFVHARAWSERVDAQGNGDTHRLAPSDALAIARDAVPQPGAGVEPGEPNGVARGDRVTVVPDDYGFDPVAGTVVVAFATEIAIQRVDERLGDLVVHFPRAGFRVVAA